MNKTIVFAETGNFCDLPHLFHFVELLYVAWVKMKERGWDRKDIKTIMFPTSPDTWKGKFHNHNQWIVETFFPNASVERGLPPGDSIVVDRATIDKGIVNKAIIKYMQKFNPFEWSDVIGPNFHNLKPVVTYISRQKSRRCLPPVVHDNLVNLLERIPDIDLRIVTMEDHDFETQVKIARETDVLIGVHGNGLTHTAFMRPHKFVCEIFPPGIPFYWDYYTLSKSMGHEYICIFDGEVKQPGMFTYKNPPCMNYPRQFLPIAFLVQTAKTEIIQQSKTPLS